MALKIKMMKYRKVEIMMKTEKKINFIFLSLNGGMVVSPVFTERNISSANDEGKYESLKMLGQFILDRFVNVYNSQSFLSACSHAILDCKNGKCPYSIQQSYIIPQDDVEDYYIDQRADNALFVQYQEKHPRTDYKKALRFFHLQKLLEYLWSYKNKPHFCEKDIIDVLTDLFHLDLMMHHISTLPNLSDDEKNLKTKTDLIEFLIHSKYLPIEKEDKTLSFVIYNDFDNAGFENYLC